VSDLDAPIPRRRGGELLRSENGRVRLGWRLSGFLAMALLIVVLGAAVLPAGGQSGSVALLAGAVGSGWLLLGLEGRSFGALGFHLSRETLSEAGKGLALGVGIGSVVVAVMALAGGVRWSSEGGSAGAWLWGGMAATVVLALPAAAEEALLRGYPLQALSEAWGAGKALVVTAVAFGVLHAWNPGAGLLSMGNVAAAGLLLGVVYLRTGSLWWATGVHLGWNWSHGYLADVPVSGLEVLDAPMYQGVPSGPEWLGGGSFGPEGSVVATVVVLSATALCWWGPWLWPGAAVLAAQPLSLVQR